MLSDKSIYFYDYESLYDVFSKEVFFTKNAFYSQLKEEQISEKTISELKKYSSYIC